jgi:hypothetical protein
MKKTVNYQLLSQQRHVLDDGQTQAPFSIFSQFNYSGKNRVVQLIASNDVDALKIGG